VQGEECSSPDPGAAKEGGKRQTRSKTAADSHLSSDDEDWLSPSQPSRMGAGGEEDDEDASDDDEEDSTSASPAAADRQYLYIQMEWCPNATRQRTCSHGSETYRLRSPLWLTVSLFCTCM